jgi:galactose mutarotase-like enzyme
MIATIINECLKLTAKDSGAELISVKNTFTNKEYLWQGDPEFWGRRAPILFPIVGKVRGNQYRAEGKTFELPQHGFARDEHFESTDKQDNSLTYVLRSNENTLKVYPYKFELTVQYRLEKNKVIVDYEVKNVDDKAIWFSIGAHPAFNCPLEKNEKFSDYYLEFEKNETASAFLLEEGLITDNKVLILNNEKIISLSTELFDNDALIFKDLRSSFVKLKSKKSTHEIIVDFTGFPYLAFWSKKGGAPFICIEPWYGIADKAGFEGQYNEKEGIKCLAKGKVFHSEYSIEINNPKR